MHRPPVRAGRPLTSSYLSFGLEVLVFAVQWPTGRRPPATNIGTLGCR